MSFRVRPQADDLALLRESARGWAREQATAAKPDTLNAPPARVARWKQIAELGWAGVALAEEQGGSNLGFAGLCALLDELGRENLASPLLSSALVAEALVRAGSQAQRSAWLARLARGEITAALAVDEHAHHDPARIATIATRTREAWLLRGHKRFVFDAAAADLLLVAARENDAGGAIGLFLVDAAVVAREPLSMVDASDCAHLHFAALALPLQAKLGEASLLDQWLDFARIGLAAEMLGSAERALERTVEYLLTRRQFDQPIGAFQALQHRAAQMLVDIEVARSAVDAAIEAVEQDSPDLPALASVAKGMANQALHRASSEAVQLHGGIGMTAEHFAGLVLKRARVAETRYGNTAFHADRYARIGGY